MGAVNNILRTKADVIFTISPDTMVYTALEIMVERNVSALLVLEEGKLAGIFTERDYARKVILKGKASKETLIREIMTSDLITVSSDTSLETCMRLMTEKLIRHLPVVDNGALVRIMSMGDVVTSIIAEQTGRRENMKHYITSN